MTAQAFLLKEKLFTFYIPEHRPNQTKAIQLDHLIEECSILPVNTGKETDIQLTNKLKEVISEKPASTRGIKIRIVGYMDGSGSIFVTSNIFLDIFIKLGEEMVLRVENDNAQVEVANTNPLQSVVKEMRTTENNGQIDFSSTCELPTRWSKYWYTTLKIKFSANISFVVCGNVAPSKPSEEGFGDVKIQNISHSIPRKLLEDKFETDIIIILDNGIKIECHKIFLQAQSSVFYSMLQKGKFLEGEANQVKLDDISENAVNALLAYLYYWGLEEPLKNPQVAVELLQASHKYDIKSLENSMKSILLGKPVEWFDIMSTIRLFFFSKNVEELCQLKTKSLQVLKKKNNELVNSDEFKALFTDEEKREEALELCSALLLAI